MRIAPLVVSLAVAASVPITGCQSAPGPQDVVVPGTNFRRWEGQSCKSKLDDLEAGLDQYLGNPATQKRYYIPYDSTEKISQAYREVEQSLAPITGSQYYAASGLREKWTDVQSKKKTLDGWVARYDALVKEKEQAVADLKSRHQQYYRESQSQAAQACPPLQVGSYLITAYALYELQVVNGEIRGEQTDKGFIFHHKSYPPYSELTPEILQYVGRGGTLQPPGERANGFTIHVEIKNTSDSRILRPHGYSVSSYNTTDSQDRVIERPVRSLNLAVYDNFGNELRPSDDRGLTSAYSKEGIRPDATAHWMLEFDSRNYPVAKADSIKVVFGPEVFGEPVSLTIPARVFSYQPRQAANAGKRFPTVTLQ